jgi:DNA mismatch endonuclease, patch repair protein
MRAVALGLPEYKKPAGARSRNMRAIKASSNVTTELRLRAHLIRNRIVGWKVRTKDLPGCPDFFFARERLAVFVDGCFWHGCPKCGHIPQTNRSYWLRKLARNKQRDAQIKRALRSEGLRVLRIWECQLRANPSHYVKKLAILLGNGPTSPEPTS